MPDRGGSAVGGGEIPTTKIKWFMKKWEKGIVKFGEFSEEREDYQIEKIGVRYRFFYPSKRRRESRLEIWALVIGEDWKIKSISVYDMSKYLKDFEFAEPSPEGRYDISATAEEAVHNDEPYRIPRLKWKKRRGAYARYRCTIGEDFGGLGFMIKVDLERPPLHLHPDTFTLRLARYNKGFFFSGLRVPTLHFVFGIKGTLTIMRYGYRADGSAVYKLARNTMTIKLPNGMFAEVADFKKAKELTDEDLKHFSIFAQFAYPRKWFVKGGKKTLGKEFLDGTFERMRNRGTLNAVIEVNPLYLGILSSYFDLDVFLKKCAVTAGKLVNEYILPDPIGNIKEMARSLERCIGLDVPIGTADRKGRPLRKDEKEPRWAGCVKFFGYAILTVAEFVPGGKTATKIVKKIDKFGSRITKGTLRESAEELGEIFRRGGKLRRKTRVKKSLERAREANPEYEEPFIEAMKDLDNVYDDVANVMDDVIKNWDSLPMDKKLEIFHTKEAVWDTARIIKMMRKRGKKSFKDFLRLSKRRRWSPLRKGRNFVNWMRIHLMRSKKFPELRFSDKVEDLLERGKSFDHKWYLPGDDFSKALDNVFKGLRRVGGKGLTKKDVGLFKKAMENAYENLVRKYGKIEAQRCVTGIEFSGKSAKGIDGSVGYLNDIDGTIIPLPPPRGSEKVRKEFFDLINTKFGDLTEEAYKGTRFSLADKDIWLYSEFGEGALNKASEGWPKELQPIYDIVENKGILTFDEAGELGKVKKIDNAVRARELGRAPGRVTPKEAELFCRKGLGQFLESENPKWLHKADLVLAKTYGREKLAKMYSPEDIEIINIARDIMLGTRPRTDLKIHQVENFLKKFGGYTDVSLKPERYVFFAKTKNEAEDIAKRVRDEIADFERDKKYWEPVARAGRRTPPRKKSIAILYETTESLEERPKQKIIQLLEDGLIELPTY